jgi:hypothetical protein
MPESFHRVKNQLQIDKPLDLVRRLQQEALKNGDRWNIIVVPMRSGGWIIGRAAEQLLKFGKRGHASANRDRPLILPIRAQD